MSTPAHTETPASSATREDLLPVCGVLKAVDNPSYAFEIPHQQTEFTVGRDLNCDQPLLGKTFLSRIHCALASGLSPDKKSYLVSIKDTSKNGSFVNNVKLPHDQPRTLASGSIISFGAPHEIAPAFEFTKYSPDSILAQYLVGNRELGRGTFGNVVEAHSRTTGSPVAVKIIKLGDFNGPSEEEQRKRVLILREVKLMAAVAHPNIVKLEKATFDESNVYLVMELAPYGNLCDLIQKHKILESDARMITRQLCDAVLHLHRSYIIHRDIKPANILIFSFEPAVIKVTDFGLAKIHDDNAPLHTICGTPAYMAPEVCAASVAAHFYDFKIDSWSIGVTLAHMLCGRIPFSEEDLQLEHGIDNRHIRPEILPANLTVEVRDLLTHLCQRDPTHRCSVFMAASHKWFDLQ